MDTSTLPSTPAGEQLKWLMSLDAEPSAEQLEAHFVEGSVRAHSELPVEVFEMARALRVLPGKVAESDAHSLRLELGVRRSVADAVLAVDPENENRITVAQVIRRSSELPASEPGRLRQMYDEVAPTYEDEVVGSIEHYSDRAAAWLADKVEDSFVVLDVGCGPGHLTAKLADSVQVLGSDVSPEMVRLAQTRRPSGRFVVHDYHFPFPADWPPADVTVALGCLDLCSDLSKVMRHLAAATKAGGRMLVTVPRFESDSPASPVREIKYPIYDVVFHLQSDDEVLQALDDAGLGVIAHDVIPGWTAPVGSVDYGIWDLRALPLPTKQAEPRD
jgi:malonyl-CoA O-methyltransferase